MGKRSRKRGGSTSPPRPTPPSASPAAPPKAVRRKAARDELPAAPWAPFPLVELCVLIGIVLIAIGFVEHNGRSAAFVLSGVALAAIAGLEQAIREHFAGFRSHTTLLSGFCAVLTIVVVSLTGVDRRIALGVAVLVFASVFGILRRAFQRRAGGLSFRA